MSRTLVAGPSSEVKLGRRTPSGGGTECKRGGAGEVTGAKGGRIRSLGRALLTSLMVFILSASILIWAGAPAFSEVRKAPNPVEGSYIVTMRNTPRSQVPSVARSLAGQHGGQLAFIYTHSLRGFSVKMHEDQAQAMSRHPRVAAVEEDGLAYTVATQTSPPSGLDRVDRRDLPLNGSYDFLATGSGVRAYIIDTGIRESHSDFGGRASRGFDAIGDGRNGEDCHGHGTHVAGTVGGSSYGVAKGVSLIGVRVLDCNGSGTWSGVIAGVDWVTGSAVRPAVANMSLGGGTSSAVDQAVAASIDSGVTYAIAAGNGNFWGWAQDACNYSPARVGPALTVSATDSTDKKASWANYGTCVDLFSPGVNIKSAWNSDDTAASTISGTSMAAPHVAGVAAKYLQSNPGATTGAIASEITANSTPNKVQSAGTGSPNKLLYSSFVPDPGNTAPLARFAISCSGLSCNFTDQSYDPDGAISAHSWNFGDSGTSTEPSPTHIYASDGAYTVTLQVTDNAGASSSTSQVVSVAAKEPESEPEPEPEPESDPDPATPNLVNGQVTEATSGSSSSWQYYKILVPSGKTLLKTELSGPKPDLDLYVRRGKKPSSFFYSCRATGSTSNDACSVSNPAGDWWYVGIRVDSGSNLPYSIKSTFSP